MRGAPRSRKGNTSANHLACPTRPAPRSLRDRHHQSARRGSPHSRDLGRPRKRPAAPGFPKRKEGSPTPNGAQRRPLRWGGSFPTPCPVHPTFFLTAIPTDHRSAPKTITSTCAPRSSPTERACASLKGGAYSTANELRSGTPAGPVPLREGEEKRRAAHAPGRKKRFWEGAKQFKKTKKNNRDFLCDVFLDWNGLPDFPQTAAELTRPGPTAALSIPRTCRALAAVR